MTAAVPVSSPAPEGLGEPRDTASPCPVKPSKKIVSITNEIGKHLILHTTCIPVKPCVASAASSQPQPRPQLSSRARAFCPASLQRGPPHTEVSPGLLVPPVEPVVTATTQKVPTEEPVVISDTPETLVDKTTVVRRSSTAKSAAVTINKLTTAQTHVNERLDKTALAATMMPSHVLGSSARNAESYSNPLEASRRVPGDGQYHSRKKFPSSRATLANRVASTRVDATCKSTRNTYHAHSYEPDRLDAHIEKAAKAFVEAPSFGDFIRKVRGRGDLHPDVGALPHPAAHLLSRYQKSGTPVVMKTAEWSPARRRAAIARGPHVSSKRGIDFLREEYADMMDKQQWTVLPAHLVIDLLGLRLSPLGLVPQRGRRDRMISDYSYFGINDETLRLAPAEAMQFGKTLIRLLTTIHHANDRFGPVYMSKVDLSDGFYRLWLRAEDAAHLAVLFPTREGEPPLVGIPLTNPMGWCDSPPNFCACTETVADLANQALADPVELNRARCEAHRLDEVSETPPEPDESVVLAKAAVPDVPATSPRKKPVREWDIYVDDFIGLSQDNRWGRRTVKRILFRALDKVFRPLDKSDTPYRQEPASIKKLKKGDATWTTTKVLLGWEVDSIRKTITLPAHRAKRLLEILGSIRPKQRYVETRQWHKILGELRSMAIAIPGAKGLFSILQEAFRHEDTRRRRLRLSSTLHGFLDDFRSLARDITSRPTRIAELVPDTFPATIGACNASSEGMGGVHFFPDSSGKLIPLLWRARFPKHISDRLVSFDNPSGDINNSDLELAGSIAHVDILATHADIRERTIHNLYDNTAAVYWQRKGATTTTGPPAYLLRLQALHQRRHRYVPRHDYIPGPANAMADTLSRCWDLTDSQMLAHFNSHFPQDKPWRVCHLSKRMLSQLISALSRQRCDYASHKDTLHGRIAIGKSGMTSACRTAWTHSCTESRTPCPSSKSSGSDTVMVDLPPAVNPWQLIQYRTPSVRSGRRLHGWGPGTSVATSLARLTSASLPKYAPTGRRIPHLTA